MAQLDKYKELVVEDPQIASSVITSPPNTRYISLEARMLIPNPEFAALLPFEARNGEELEFVATVLIGLLKMRTMKSS